MSDQIRVELIGQEPSARIEEPIATELAKKEQEAFEPAGVRPEGADEYNAADTQHKIDLLKLKVDAENLRLDQRRIDIYREVENLRLDQRRIDIDREKAHVDGLRQDIEARKDYSNKIFKLVSCWLTGVLLVMIGNIFIGKLSDAVIMALIGGTTVNVLGLFLVVANYLFPKNGKLAISASPNTDKL